MFRQRLHLRITTMVISHRRVTESSTIFSAKLTESYSMNVHYEKQCYYQWRS